MRRASLILAFLLAACTAVDYLPLSDAGESDMSPCVAKCLHYFPDADCAGACKP